MSVSGLVGSVRVRRAADLQEATVSLVQDVLDLGHRPRVEVQIALPDAVSAAWTESTVLYRRAAEDKKRAGRLRRQAVRELLEAGWTQTDVSTALGLSHQRIQQLARTGS